MRHHGIDIMSTESSIRHILASVQSSMLCDSVRSAIVHESTRATKRGNGLPLLPGSDIPNVLSKALCHELVGLVQHQRPDLAGLQGAGLQQRADAARCADRDMAAPAHASAAGRPFLRLAPSQNSCGPHPNLRLCSSERWAASATLPACCLTYSKQADLGEGRRSFIPAVTQVSQTVNHVYAPAQEHLVILDGQASNERADNQTRCLGRKRPQHGRHLQRYLTRRREDQRLHIGTACLPLQAG